MPPFSRLSLRLSLLYLMLGFTLGALMLINKGFHLDAAYWRLLPVHIQFLFIGWIVQMVIGVAFWILPRFWNNRRRGNVKAAYLALAMLNAGIWLSVTAALFESQPALSTSATILELAGAALFAAVIWFRIVPRNVSP